MKTEVLWKICPKCQKRVLLGKWPIGKKTKRALAVCSGCVVKFAEAKNKWRKNNPDKVKKSTKKSNAKYYSDPENKKKKYEKEKQWVAKNKDRLAALRKARNAELKRGYTLAKEKGLI